LKFIELVCTKHNFSIVVTAFDSLTKFIFGIIYSFLLYHRFVKHLIHFLTNKL